MILLSLLVFLFVSFFGYWVHRGLHKKFSGPFGKSHKTHHEIMYPVTDFKSDKYRSAGKDSSLIFFAVISIPIVALPFLLSFLGILSLVKALLIVGQMIFWGWLHNYIHDAFHINNHWLSRVPVVKIWFNRLIDLHFGHHCDVQKNFGIFFFGWDRLFGTYMNNP